MAYGSGEPITEAFEQRVYHPKRAPELDDPAHIRHVPVVIVGAGPVGLTLAVDLAQRGVEVILLDEDHRLASGSRALCFAKRTLEIFDRLGVASRLVDYGVRWRVGKVFHRDHLIYQFDLLPEDGHKQPAFINVQQWAVEGVLVDRAMELPQIDLRWKSRVVGVESRRNGALVAIDSPDGSYSLHADWVVACDGSKSPVRSMIGQESKGRVFHDRFLIADVRMKAEFPTERWFWFDPPFHPNQSVLLHRQPDDVWRIDFQLGWDAEPEVEKHPEKVLPRVRALLGHDADFELIWCSVYTFACMRMQGFKHERVIFAGDSAHGVSPFGARGANSGIQDAENLAWKLARVVQGLSPESLIDSYDDERVEAADENIRHSTRSTDFITPKSRISRVFRDAVLSLASDAPFARALVNSGRLSTPCHYSASPLSTDDETGADGSSEWSCPIKPGSPAVDAPLRGAAGEFGGSAWLLDALQGRFVMLEALGSEPKDGGDTHESTHEGVAMLRQYDANAVTLRIPAETHPELVKRYDLRPGSAYLFRPDQHVAARSRRPSLEWLRAALDQACGFHAPPGRHPKPRSRPEADTPQQGPRSSHSG